MGPDYPFGRTAEDYDAELEEIEQEWGTFALAQKWMSSLDPETAEDPHEVEDFVGWMQSIGGPGDAVRWSTMDRDVDLRDVLSSIRVPTLVLHGLGDLEASIEHGRYLAQHIPGAELREMPGSTHMWSHSDDLPVEIERFLTTLHAEQVEFDRYLATVLFTDIVGSTEIVTAGGDAAWRDLVERQSHRARRTRPIPRHGDGHCGRRVLRDLRWPGSCGPLRPGHRGCGSRPLPRDPGGRTHG